MNLKSLNIDSTWSLFLDRDGVINKRIEGDYVKKWEEFEFLPGVPEALSFFAGIFGKIFIVTNQQGIGKGLMSESDLENIHDQMIQEIKNSGGRINKVYHSPYRDEEHSVFRKPNIGLARKAKIDFPDVQFEKSIMAGDSKTDIQFGKNTGMYTALISADKELRKENIEMIDFSFTNLLSFAEALIHKP
jgi:histidinol-phosphate phosphatase family protein